MDPYGLTIAEMASLIKARQLSPVELMKSVLSRSEALDNKLNVWVTLQPDILITDAKRCEAQIVKYGTHGLLEGVPIGLKDIYLTKGDRTTACSELFKDFISDYDANCVTALRNSGSIIMGKLVTTPYAALDPSPTVNPWDAALTPGGSSSGSAVAVSTGICPGALGSQTVGSTLRPAAYNGIIGFKPTFDRINVLGILPLCPSLDTVGILTRTVQDAALLLQVMAGSEASHSIPPINPIGDYLDGLFDSMDKPKIGIIKNFFYENCDLETKDHTNLVASKLQNAGAEVRELKHSLSLKELEDATNVTFNVEASQTYGDNYRKTPRFFPPLISRIIEQGLQTSAQKYAEAQLVRSCLRAELTQAFKDVDILMSPSTPGQAPRRITGTTGPALFQGPWTTTGLPSISIPSGIDREGLPFGLQLASRWFQEAFLLRSAQWCTEVLGSLPNLPINQPNEGLPMGHPL